jgi:hypothetical protein
MEVIKMPIFSNGSLYWNNRELLTMLWTQVCTNQQSVMCCHATTELLLDTLTAAKEWNSGWHMLTFCASITVMITKQLQENGCRSMAFIYKMNYD